MQSKRLKLVGVSRPIKKNRSKNASQTHVTQAVVPVQQQASALGIPRDVGCFMPDRLRTYLRFWKSIPINLNPLTYAAVRLTPTSVFDIDPTGGARQPPGFAQLSAIYGSYRVKSSSCKVEAYNEGDVTTQVTLVPTNLDPGTSPTSHYVVSSREQPYAVSAMLAAVGGPKTTLVNQMSTRKIFGSPMTDYDDNFAALVTTVPVNNWFWVVTCYAQAVATKAILLHQYLEIEVEFYDRYSINTS